MARRYKFEDYEAVWQNSQASGNDLLILLALVKFRQPKGMYATRETLAELLKCNVDTVDRSLKRLKELGELDWVKGSDRAKRANRYAILLPGLDKNTPLNSPRNSPRNSQEIPPETHEKYPPNITPLNSIETEGNSIKQKTVFDSTFASPFMMKSCDRVAGVLSPLQVSDLLSTFAGSYDCSSAYTDQIRVARWWSYLNNAASQAEREM
jgi:hypothetical protein